ncbi:MAG: hypothetical protein M1441_01340 [Candidatus Parvarchaeota archaeon]|jgi:ribosomal protein L22|nr:hypothetical protein [Candidatus Parvarchaeota archaeon]
MATKVSSARESLPISKKHVHEIAEAIKGKNIDRAIAYLERVKAQKDFVPFMKYPSKGHKHGIPAGYPKKASVQIIRMLKELKANAKYMGFEVSALTVSGYMLGRGAYPRYGGGKVYRRGKRTNITLYTIVNQERKKEEKKPEAAPQETKKEETKEIKAEETNKSEAKDVTKENN